MIAWLTTWIIDAATGIFTGITANLLTRKRGKEHKPYPFTQDDIGTTVSHATKGKGLILAVDAKCVTVRFAGMAKPIRIVHHYLKRDS